MTSTQFFINYLENFSYLSIFILSALVGYLIPIPEEILLLLVGYIAGSGFYNLYLAAFFSIFGVIFSDNVIFWLSTRNSVGLIKKLKQRFDRDKIKKYRRLMKKHIGKTIFVLKFIVGLRFLSPLLAGSMNVKWKIFQFYDLLAVAIYVPLIIFIGFHFHNQLEFLVTGVQVARHLIFLLILILAGILVTIFARNKHNHFKVV